MTQRQPTTTVLSAAEFQAITDEFLIAEPAANEPTADGVRVGGFELSRSEFETLAAALAGRPVPIESVQLTLSSDGSFRATWINATDPRTVSSLLIRPAD
ncbi:MAG: hypothetical protein ABSG64_12655 [Solirubrobacteraceae bacterium]|jgi:hypothetical protein